MQAQQRFPVPEGRHGVPVSGDLGSRKRASTTESPSWAHPGSSRHRQRGPQTLLRAGIKLGPARHGGRGEQLLAARPGGGASMKEAGGGRAPVDRHGVPEISCKLSLEYHLSVPQVDLRGGKGDYWQKGGMQFTCITAGVCAHLRTASIYRHHCCRRRRHAGRLRYYPNHLHHCYRLRSRHKPWYRHSCSHAAPRTQVNMRRDR